MITFYKYKLSFYNTFEVCAKPQLNSSLWISIHLASADLTKCYLDVERTNLKVGCLFWFLFFPKNIFVAALSVTLDTEAFPNLNKENPAFLCWNPSVTGAFSPCKQILSIY